MPKIITEKPSFIDMCKIIQYLDEIKNATESLAETENTPVQATTNLLVIVRNFADHVERVLTTPDSESDEDTY